MNTFTGNHKAVVKETKHRTPYISFELIDKQKQKIKDTAEIGMILKKETTVEEANKIVEIINEKMVGLFITNF